MSVRLALKEMVMENADSANGRDSVNAGGGVSAGTGGAVRAASLPRRASVSANAADRRPRGGCRQQVGGF